MRFRHSLRFRAAVAFAAFGAFVSLLLSIAVFFAARDIERRLLSETLAVELEDFMARRARRPGALGICASGRQCSPWLWISLRTR